MRACCTRGDATAEARAVLQPLSRGDNHNTSHNSHSGDGTMGGFNSSNRSAPAAVAAGALMRSRPPDPHLLRMMMMVC